KVLAVFDLTARAAVHQRIKNTTEDLSFNSGIVKLPEGEEGTASEVGISILRVGTFTVLDLRRMQSWHELSGKIDMTIDLSRFAGNIVIE
ncbi:hypothetical protein GN958_ATG19145, partial [Phytophthora infestans]